MSVLLVVGPFHYKLSLALIEHAVDFTHYNLSTSIMSSPKEKTILLKILWCTHCLRQSAKRFDSETWLVCGAVGFFIDCSSALDASAACVKCSGRKGLCERVSLGMLNHFCTSLFC